MDEWTKVDTRSVPTITDGVHGPGCHTHLTTIEHYPQKRCLQRTKLLLRVTAFVEKFGTSLVK